MVGEIQDVLSSSRWTRHRQRIPLGLTLALLSNFLHTVKANDLLHRLTHCPEARVRRRLPRLGLISPENAPFPRGPAEGFKCNKGDRYLDALVPVRCPRVFPIIAVFHRVTSCRFRMLSSLASPAAAAEKTRALRRTRDSLSLGPFVHSQLLFHFGHNLHQTLPVLIAEFIACEHLCQNEQTVTKEFSLHRAKIAWNASLAR